MKKLKYIKAFIFKKIVSLDKKGMFYALRSVYKDSMIRRLSDASDFSWEKTHINKNPKQFEDLTSLFFCSPLNRGILRQDFDEAALLYKTIAGIKNPKGVEIGRFNGGSTVMITTAIGENGKLYSIDISPKNNDEELIKVLEQLGLKNRVNLIIDDANKIEIDDTLDFVFIDGDHSYEGARLDHNKWGKQIKKGGYIIHHDMSNARKHTVQWNDLAVLYKDILENQKEGLEEFGSKGGLVIFKKTSDKWVDIAPKSEFAIKNIAGKVTKTNSYLDRE